MFKKSKLISLGLIIFLVSAGCISGGGGSSSGQITLNVWGLFDSSDNMQSFFSAFQQQHSNVKIVYTEKNVDTYEQDLLNALASGNGPDVFEIHNDWLPNYEDKMVPAPATTLTAKDYSSAFVDVAKNDFVTSDGKVFALPLTVDTLQLYYNKDILGSAGIATPPKTWSDLIKDVKLVTRQTASGSFTRSGVAMGTTSNINRAVDILYLLMLQNNSSYYTSDFSQSTLDQAVQDKSGNTIFPAAKALDFYTSFANPASDVYNWNQNSNYSIDAFANGELAFLYGYSFTRDTILQKAPNLNFDVAPVPQPTADQNPVNFANYWGYGVSKQAKRPDAAWALVKFMGTKDQQEAYYKKHSQPSGRRDIISEQTSDPVIGNFAFANLTAKSFYKKDQGKVDDIMTGMIDDVILHGKTVDEVISKAVQQINLLNTQ